MKIYEMFNADGLWIVYYTIHLNSHFYGAYTTKEKAKETIDKLNKI